jgi:hypothetical protein
MSVLTITIVDPNFAGQRKSSEVAYLLRALAVAKTEIGRGNGVRTSGTILGTNQAGTPNTSLGSWSYVPSATLP